MKVRVNLINTWCIVMSAAVTVPNLMMTLIISEESLVRDTHTHTHTQRIRTVIFLKFAFANKKEGKKEERTEIIFPAEGS